jgi:hypothetical protein
MGITLIIQQGMVLSWFILRSTVIRRLNFFKSLRTKTVGFWDPTVF